MDRTFFGYRKQCAPLLVGELTHEPNLDIDVIDQAPLVSAVSTVLGMHLRVRQVDMHALKGPALARGIHSQRDRFACSQCRQEEFVGIRGGILASRAKGFICLKCMSPSTDVLQEVR
jgi:hypothetical protein